MKNIIILLFIYISGNIYAQTDFRSGKIIKFNGDTLVGELNYQGDTENSKLIQFKNHDIDAVFKPFEIKSYGFDNGKFYTSKIAIIDRDTVKIFAEYLVDGKKDLFFNRSESGFHYLVSISDSIIKEIPFRIEVINKDGVNYQRESKLHLGYLKTYFNDCPSLFPRIEKIKALERKPLMLLTKDYNDITCGKGTCIIYDRKEYPIRIALEPVYSYYLKNMLKSDTTISAYGMNIYFWKPNSSERLYIKTGLYIAQLSPVNYFQIPLQFEYVYPFKRIKPKYHIGTNIHFLKEEGNLTGFTLTTLAGGGCYIKLANWIYLDIDISSDLFAFNYSTTFIESFALRTGLYFSIGKKPTTSKHQNPSK